MARQLEFETRKQQAFSKLNSKMNSWNMQNLGRTPEFLWKAFHTLFSMG
jgi:hypothetical protein